MGERVSSSIKYSIQEETLPWRCQRKRQGKAQEMGAGATEKGRVNGGPHAKRTKNKNRRWGAKKGGGLGASALFLFSSQVVKRTIRCGTRCVFRLSVALLVASRLTERERERERMRQEERAREAKKEGEKRKCFSALLHSFPFPSSRRRIQLAPPPPFSVSSPSLSLSIHHGFEPQRQGRPGRGVYQGVRRALALQRQGKYFEAGIKEAIGRRRRRPLSSIVRREAAERAPAPRGPWSSAPIFSAESMPSLRPERWRRAAV